MSWLQWPTSNIALQHIRDETQKALPDWKIFSVVYPKYETKGDLSTCVTRFREWYDTFLQCARGSCYATQYPDMLQVAEMC